LWVSLNISPLIDPDGRGMEEGDFLEEILVTQATDAIRSLLRQGRAAIPNHP
jgi:hypothetical protein